MQEVRGGSTVETAPRRRARTIARGRRAPAEPGADEARIEPIVAGDGARASRDLRLLNVGYGNLVAAERLIAIISPQSAPMRRFRSEAEGRFKLVDATQGRRTRSILVTDSDHVILSALNPETIAARLAPEADADDAGRA